MHRALSCAEEDKKKLEAATEELKALTDYMKKVWAREGAARALLAAVKPAWLPGAAHLAIDQG